jgi:Kef-type K+ transport system membrane component KefB
MILGYSIGKLFNYPDISSISIGIALTISSVGMGTRVLMDLNRLNTSCGMTLVSVAVIDDVSEVLMLGLLLGIASNGGVIASNQFLNQILKLALFFLIIFLIGFHVKIPERLKKFTERSRAIGTKLSYVFVVMFATMGLAYVAGLHIILGAFFAGLMLNKAFREDREIHRTIMLVTFGLFAPIAYEWVVQNTMLSALATTNLPLLLSIILAGLGGEILGGGVGSKLAGLSWRESLIVGVGLTGRAGIELIVIEVMRLAGLITLEVYSSLVVLTALACLLMPFMLKLACTSVLGPKSPPLNNN